MRTRLCIQPRGPQLAHACIDQGDACLAALPGLHGRRIVAPGKAAKRSSSGLSLVCGK